eukprot:2229571-Rhodomonas_salina.3
MLDNDGAFSSNEAAPFRSKRCAMLGREVSRSDHTVSGISLYNEVSAHIPLRYGFSGTDLAYQDTTPTSDGARTPRKKLRPSTAPILGYAGYGAHKSKTREEEFQRSLSPEQKRKIAEIQINYRNSNYLGARLVIYVLPAHMLVPSTKCLGVQSYRRNWGDECMLILFQVLTCCYAATRATPPRSKYDAVPKIRYNPLAPTPKFGGTPSYLPTRAQYTACLRARNLTFLPAYA